MLARVPPQALLVTSLESSDRQGLSGCMSKVVLFLVVFLRSMSSGNCTGVFLGNDDVNRRRHPHGRLESNFTLALQMRKPT